MRIFLWWPTKPTAFAILMVSTAVLALLPTRWTGCAASVTQPVSPLTWVLSSFVRNARTTSDNITSSTPSVEQFRQLEQLNQNYELQLQQQAVMITELEDIIRDVTGLRNQLNDERVRIVIAAVIGGETSPRRETIRISKGARQGLQVGDWVAAGLPRESATSGRNGRELLMQQWLIGVVSQVFPYVSDVQLTTDPGFRPTNVFWVANPASDERWELARRECGLVGVGNGMMRIEQAAQDYLKEGYIYVLAPLSYPQPLALAVGKIKDAKALDTGLHYQFEVEPWASVRELSHVYVISLSEPR